MTAQTSNSAAIQLAIAEAKSRYRASNPKSLAQHQKAARVLPGGNTRTVLFSDPFPITLTSAEGCRVTSLDGRTYTDFLGEFTAGLYGHSDPVLKQAMLQAMESGWVRGGHIEQEEQLASLICDRFPSIAQIRFANSGTEATLYALASARVVSGKNKVIVFEGAYHGGVFTFGAQTSPLNAPFDFVRAPFNNWEGTEALLDANREDLACVIIEPMQGSAGCIAADPEFLRALRAWTMARGVILIFDEVQTSRLAGGGLQGVYGIEPDMTTLGKYIGGGFSFGAFGGRADIMERFNPLRPDYIAHAGTFNNNVFTMSVGVAGLSKLYTPEVAAALTARGDALRTRLNEIASKALFPMQFTGIGSMMNVHMCEGPVRSIRDLTVSNMPLRDLFYFDMVEQGFWPARRGMFNLSLPMGEAEINGLIDAVARFVRERNALAQ
ncbi:aspartate aminotransferase family protein [Ottowia thiooxydans]|uniref:aspartate aminotransferase family protein n=1 Tax=Ottowia thiooxydans TaxID=219182 RepID=UPI000416C8E3|nr:aminotransferase class III-fold pyridoxal phosphate-dependent enzyme [Ottowia thiooxydans]